MSYTRVRHHVLVFDSFHPHLSHLSGLHRWLWGNHSDCPDVSSATLKAWKSNHTYNMHIPGVIAHLFSEVTCCYASHDKQHMGATGHITHPHQDHATGPRGNKKKSTRRQKHSRTTRVSDHTHILWFSIVVDHTDTYGPGSRTIMSFRPYPLLRIAVEIFIRSVPSFPEISEHWLFIK